MPLNQALVVWYLFSDLQHRILSGYRDQDGRKAVSHAEKRKENNYQAICIHPLPWDGAETGAALADHRMVSFLVSAIDSQVFTMALKTNSV